MNTFVNSLYKRDSRAIFLYVQDISDDDYHIFFSSDIQAQRWNFFFIVLFMPC